MEDTEKNSFCRISVSMKLKNMPVSRTILRGLSDCRHSCILPFVLSFLLSLCVADRLNRGERINGASRTIYYPLNHKQSTFLSVDFTSQ